MELVKILFFALHLFPTINAENDCRPSSCGNNPFPVRFPFQLLQQQQPRNNCGYPGFDLSCTGKNPKVVLTLPRYGDFNVRNIDYLAQEIQLYDPDNCMPGRLLSFDLSSSSSLLPFAPVYSQNLTFLRCPSETVMDHFVTVDCLSNSTWSVIATASMSFAGSMNTCSSIATLPVPVSWPQNSNWITADLNGDLCLTWNDPNCEGCEARGGTCGFENSTSDQVFCFDDRGRDGSSGMLIFKIIALSIVVPAVACSICVSCFLIVVERRRNDTRRRDSDISPPLPDSAMTGLDDSTIESYAKVVLGESKRLSGPNGTTCPICLVDYFPRDTIRSIPMCNHCFHLDCIDEWLRINGTCPVCRYSPSPSPSPQAN